MQEPIFIIVDLFCGAGGTTTGFVQAALDRNNIAKVIACVNHDAKAIKSHWMNHPEVKHFEEDIRTLDLKELTKIVKTEKVKHPDAYLILWASLECTNFSKAGYHLDGNQSDQKKFIGNSVVPHVVKAWTEAMALKLIENGKKKVA